MVTLSRWEAIKIAFLMLWFASGTSRMRISLSESKIVFEGSELIKED